VDGVFWNLVIYFVPNVVPKFPISSHFFFLIASHFYPISFALSSTLVIHISSPKEEIAIFLFLILGLPKFITFIFDKYTYHK